MVATAPRSNIELLHLLMREESRPLVRKAAKLAPIFAKRAYRQDEDSSFPFADFADLHRAKLLGLTIPESYGGTMVSHLTRGAIFEQIASGNEATGLSFVMHSTTAGFAATCGKAITKSILFSDIIEKGAILASCTTEPKKTFRGPYRLDTEFIEEPDGYRVKGEKAFASNAEAATYYMVNGKLRSASSTKTGFMLAAIPAKDITITNRWSSGAMRSTCSHAIKFDTVVPHSLIVGEPGQLLETIEFSNFMFGYALVALGIMKAALDYTKNVTFKKYRTMGEHDGHILGLIEEKIQDCRAAAVRAAIARDEMSEDAVRLTAIAKYEATEAAPEVTWQCIKLAGGRGILRGPEYPLERWHRNSLAGALMPSPNLRLEQTEFGRLAPIIQWD